MSEVLRYFVIFGLQSAAIYAIAASGLVVTYTTSGIFNFAHGAIGMIIAFTYWQMTASSEWGWPIPVALVVCLGIVAPLFGLLLDRVLMRRLAGASTVTTIVITIGLLVALVSLAGIIWPSGASEGLRRLPEFFPGERFEVLDVNVSYHSVLSLAIAIAVAVGLRLLLFRSRIGVAMRAVVDNRELSSLHGVRPDRVSGAAWMIGCTLAGLGGILIAPVLPQFTPIILTLLVIQAYAAAMVGRLRSLPLTFLGALILAEIENGLAFVQAKGWGSDRFADQVGNLAPAAPIIMLFVVLLVLREDRAALRPERFRFRVPKPSMRTVAVGMGVLIAVVAVVGQFDLVSVGTRNELGKGLALGIVMLSLVLLTGWAGQVSLAQLGLAGVAAVAVWKVGSLGGLVVGVVVAGFVGGLVALPALRMRSLYLALTTMAFALLLETVVYGNNAVVSAFLPFSTSQASAPRPGFLKGDTAFFITLAVAFALVALGLTVIRNGHFGRRLSAMKDSPAACATLGLDLTVTKLQVFSLASAIAGFGGALLAMWKVTNVGRSDFALLEGPLPGLALLLVAVIGGITSVAGAVFGFIAFIGAPLVGGWYSWLKNPMNLAPGLVGIGLAENPDGAVSQISEAIKEARTAEKPVDVLARPEGLGIDGPLTDDEVAALDDELGLSWGRT